MARFRVNKILLLMKINYFFGMGGYAPYLPFLTTIARQRGYSAFIVGLLFTVQQIPTLFLRPFIGVITDNYKCRRLVFVGSTGTLFLLMCMLWIIPGKTSNVQLNDLDVIKSPVFWWFSGTVSLINVASMTKTILENAVCMNLLGDKQNQYGKQRLWGSVGWSLMAIVSGTCVDWYSKGQEFKNYTPSYIISLLCFTINFFVALKIKVIQESDNKVINSVVKKVFIEGRVLAFFLWAILFGFFSSFLPNFLFWYLEDLADLYHPETKSWMKTLQGLSLIIRCFVGEVPSFFLSSYILKRVNHMTVFSLMFLIIAIGFSTYSFIRDPSWTLPLESLNGVMFGMTYSTAVSYTALLTPTGAEGTFQSAINTAFYGIGGPVGSLAGGYIFKHLGSIESFRVLGLIALGTCVVQSIVEYLISRLNGNKDAAVTSKDNAENETAISVL